MFLMKFNIEITIVYLYNICIYTANNKKKKPRQFQIAINNYKNVNIF